MDKWIYKETKKVEAAEIVCPICNESCLVWEGCTYEHCPNCGEKVNIKEV